MTSAPAAKPSDVPWHTRRWRCLAVCGFLAACAPHAELQGEIHPYDPDACGKVECRPLGHFSMRIQDGERMNVPLPGMPYVYAGRVHLLRGESFRVDPTVVRGELVGLAYGGNTSSPRRMFQFSLKRTDGHSELEVENPFSRTLLFRAAAVDSQTLRYSELRVCAIDPDDRGGGRWPEGIDGLVVYEIALVESLVWPASSCWRWPIG